MKRAEFLDVNPYSLGDENLRGKYHCVTFHKAVDLHGVE
jgi:hypothetical protein